MEYKVYARLKKEKRHHIWYRTNDPIIADKTATRMTYSECPTYTGVYVVATDDNGITNKLIYK